MVLPRTVSATRQIVECDGWCTRLLPAAAAAAALTTFACTLILSTIADMHSGTIDGTAHSPQAINTAAAPAALIVKCTFPGNVRTTIAVRASDSHTVAEVFGARIKRRGFVVEACRLVDSAGGVVSWDASAYSTFSDLTKASGEGAAVSVVVNSIEGQPDDAVDNHSHGMPVIDEGNAVLTSAAYTGPDPAELLACDAPMMVPVQCNDSSDDARSNVDSTVCFGSDFTDEGGCSLPDIDADADADADDDCTEVSSANGASSTVECVFSVRCAFATDFFVLVVFWGGCCCESLYDFGLSFESLSAILICTVSLTFSNPVLSRLSSL